MPEPVALSKKRCSSTENGGAEAQPARPVATAMAPIAMEMLLLRVTASPPDKVRRIAGTPLGAQAINKKLTIRAPPQPGFAHDCATASLPVFGEGGSRGG